MKQHILEHWIKLAQEIRDGLKSEAFEEELLKLDNSEETREEVEDLIFNLQHIRHALEMLNK
jgi:hypothetical protein